MAFARALPTDFPSSILFPVVDERSMHARDASDTDTVNEYHESLGHPNMEIKDFLGCAFGFAWLIAWRCDMSCRMHQKCAAFSCGIM